LVRNRWALVQVDNPDGTSKSPYGYFISSGSASGELMFSTTKSDGSYVVMISWLSNKNFPRKNVSGADLRVDASAIIELSSCTMNSCDAQLDATRDLFNLLRNGNDLTFGIDVIDPAMRIERTVPLSGIGPILDAINHWIDTNVGQVALRSTTHLLNIDSRTMRNTSLGSGERLAGHLSFAQR
jgi:hypothetical protein